LRNKAILFPLANGPQQRPAVLAPGCWLQHEQDLRCLSPVRGLVSRNRRSPNSIEAILKSNALKMTDGNLKRFEGFRARPTRSNHIIIFSLGLLRWRCASTQPGIPPIRVLVLKIRSGPAIIMHHGERL
jgi:hypothetical protein